MNRTRIIRVYIPGGKVAHVEMYCGDGLYSIPDHLISKYPESFKGWKYGEIGLYHRAAGWLSPWFKVENLSADLELIVVRRDVAAERQIRQPPFPPLPDPNNALTIFADDEGYQCAARVMTFWFPCFRSWPTTEDDLEVMNVQWPPLSGSGAAVDLQSITMVQPRVPLRP